MVEEERKLQQKEILRLENEIEVCQQGSETQIFMIKNRLHVLAQYLRVKLPMEEQDVEVILKLIIDSLKYSKSN